MLFLKQSTAFTFRAGPFVDSTNGVTAEDGLTILQADCQISKAGAAFAQKNDATGGTHDTDGWYSIPFNTTDTATLGTLQLQIVIAGALPVFMEFSVVTANVFDTLFSTDVFDANVTTIAANAVSATAIADSAISAAKFAAGAIDAAAIDTGAIDADAIAANAIAATKIATGAITAAKFAAGAVDAAALAADAVTEIQVGLATSAEVATAQADLDKLTGTDGATLATAQGNYAPALASIATEARLAELDAANLPADVDTLLTRITSTIFAGITSLAEWLGLLANKQAADATALAEIKLTGAGSGGYSELSDSLEAIKDSGGGGLTAQEVRDSMKLAPTAGAPSAGSVDEHLDDVLLGTGTTIPGLIGSPVSDLATDVAGIQSDTDDLQTQIGTAGAGLTDLGAMSTGMKAEMQAEAAAALVAVNLDHLVGADAPAAPTAGSWLGDMIEDSTKWRFTTEALAQGPSGTGQTQYFVFGAAVQDDENLVTWHAYCLKNGVPVTGSNCVVQLYKDDGDGTITTVTGATDTVGTPDANFVFNESMEVVLVAGALYYYKVTITVDAATRTGFISVMVPERTAS